MMEFLRGITFLKWLAAEGRSLTITRASWLAKV